MIQIPKNVMQIGEVNSHTKIYMEDYVHTFLERRKKSEEYLAFGKKEERGDVLYYLIYGVEKRTDWDRGSYPYFKKYERIGTIEGMANKLTFKPVRGSGIALDGFFIFYEQNEDMQSYMIVVRENEEIAGSEEREAVMEAVQSRREQQKKALEAVKAQEEKPAAPKLEESVRKKTVKIKSTDGILQSLQKKAKKNAGSVFRKKERGAAGKRRAFRSGQNGIHTWTIPDLCRAGSMVLLLLLVAFGLTSVNRYPDMKAVTELFSEAAKAVRGEKEAAVAVDASAQSDGLIVEEITAGQTAGVEEAVMNETETGGEVILAQDGEEGIRWTIGESGQEEDRSLAETAAQEKNTADQDTGAVPAETTDQTAELKTEESGEALENVAAGESEEDTAAVEAPDNSASETAAEAATQAIARPVSYVVKKGDSLAGIARKFYGNASMVWEICDINQIENPDQIHPGQNILLP